MKLQARLKDFANKISGTSVVDNTKNPDSASYKATHPVKAAFVSNPNPNNSNGLPKQEVYGVPDVTKKSQLAGKIK